MPESRPRSTVLVVAVLVALTLTACEPFAGPSDADATAAPTSPAATDLPTFDAASTVGGYAPGFPVDLLAGPDDAVVLASSAAPRDGLVDVSLNLATDVGTRKIVRRYARQLDAAGFEESGQADGTALAVQTVFTRTTSTKKETVVESVQIGVLDDGGRRLVTVSGSVAAPEG